MESTGSTPNANAGSWADSNRGLEERVQALIADLRPEEVARVVCNDFEPFERRGLPKPFYTDGPSGVRDAVGVTALPACISLAATFDPDLAREYGAVLGVETRHVGRNVVLGPTLDIARDPNGGRVPEGFGEDPELVAQIGVALALGVQSVHAISMLKHLIANNFESRRTGWGTPERRGDNVDARVDETTLHETYLRPFRRAVNAGIWSIMGSYNRLNGRYTCQSRDLLDIPRLRWGWKGFYAPDFMFAVRDAGEAYAAGLDLPALGGPDRRTPDMIATVAAEHSVEMVRRVARAIIGCGVADHPAVAADGDPTSPAHRRLAREVAAQSAVLLLNRDETLPLGRRAIESVAVIGPSGMDAIFTMGGSASVTLDEGRVTTPIDGIRSRAGSDVRIEQAQGSWGDVPLPDVPHEALTLPDQRGPGVELVIRSTDADGTPVERHRVITQVEVPNTPDGVAGYWTATLRTLLTSSVDGWHRLSLLVAGHASLSVDGETLMTGAREAHKFIGGPHYPIQALVDLRAGEPRLVEVTYELGPGIELAEFGLRPGVRLGWQLPDRLREEAAEVAAGCDAAIVIVNTASGEGMDRTGLQLPGDQDDLVRAIAAANPRTVVVLNTPGAVLMPWLDSVQAVLAVWYPGETFGDALADVLFGDVAPGGRLPLTFPRATEDLPGLQGAGLSPDSVEYDEGNAVGYRHLAMTGTTSLFPFGYGLSYGAHDMVVSGVEAEGATVRVAVSLTEISGQATSATVQGYVRPADDPTMPRRLVGFSRVRLGAAEKRDIVLTVGPAAWSSFDQASGDLVVRDGTYELAVAEHAEDPGTIVWLDITEGRAAVRVS